MALSGAAGQAWPPFVLVTGVLLIGLVAHADGLFPRAGRMLERVPGPPAALLAAGMALVAVVTAVLNLDSGGGLPDAAVGSGSPSGAGSPPRRATRRAGAGRPQQPAGDGLLSGQAPPHPRALLIGLNLGPNLAVTGSPSACLWIRAARQVGARPRAAAFTGRGVVLAPAAIVGALLAASVLGTPV